MKNILSKLRKTMALPLAVMLIASGCAQKSATKKDPVPASSAAPAAAVKWAPDKPITMTVAAGAGGATDMQARAVEKVWKKYCSQDLVVVNKGGGGGIDGSNFVSKAKPDGLNILMGLGGGADIVSPHLQDNMPLDPLKDLIPVTRLSVHSVVILVPANSPFKTINDIVDWAKKEKKPVTAAVSVTAGAVDFVMRGIGVAAGIEVTPIPHSGGAQALTTLMGGQTVMGGGHPAEVMAHVKSGKLRAIAIATPERDPALKDVPTLKKQGINMFTWGSVKGIGLPKGTPQNIVDYYADLFKKICEDSDYKKLMEELTMPIQYQGPADFAKFLKEASDDYAKKVKEYKIPKS